jgi:hypothetical protein
MARRLLTALFALCFANAAFSQSIGGFNVPSDLTGQPGGGYVSVPPVYKTDGSANVEVDPAVTPPTATELTDIPMPSDTGRIVVGSQPNSTAGFCDTDAFGGTTTHPGTSCPEAKFRTHVDFSHILPDDPIRNARQPGGSHLHCFFGSGSTNAYSTYASLRNQALRSTAAGTDANGTGYWYPCVVSVNPNGDGKNYVIALNIAIVYYIISQATEAPFATHLPIGLRYVFGYEMDDDWAWLQTIIDAANAASSNHSRYSLRNPTGRRWAQAYYLCQGATADPSAARSEQGVGATDYLRLPGGGDPYNGTCNGSNVTASISGTTLTVAAVNKGGSIGVGQYVRGPGINENTIVTALGTGTGGVGTYTVNISASVASTNINIGHLFYIGVNGNDCWDGKNLWSPGGYKHVVPRIYDSNGSKFVCPSNYYRIPPITLELAFTQYGWSDRQHWELSSDLSKRGGTAFTAGNPWVPGLTFHTDWMFGWDFTTMMKWQHNCIGVEHNIPHQCSTSIISKTERLMGGIEGEAGAGGRPSQITTTWLNHVNPGDPGYILVAPSWAGSLAGMHIHH